MISFVILSAFIIGFVAGASAVLLVALFKWGGQQ